MVGLWDCLGAESEEQKKKKKKKNEEENNFRKFEKWPPSSKLHWREKLLQKNWLHGCANKITM